MHTDEELLGDLKRVAAKLGRSPTQDEYATHGQYSSTTFQDRFGTWNKAKRTAGLDITRLGKISDRELLKELRQKSKNAKSHGDLFSCLEYSERPYWERFGGRWQACVRAGQIPDRRVPLSEEEYGSYLQAAVSSSRPSTSLYGLLRGFTGLTRPILLNFEFSWLSRVDSDVQPILIRVPPNHLPTTGHWELLLPDHFTTAAGDRKPTHLKPLLQWMMRTGTLCGYDKGQESRPNRVINKASIDANVGELRATLATHLARRGIDRFEIEMQVGAEKTNWDRSVEDYFLYLYQFEDYCHPDYEPSGTYLDPGSGEPERIESEAD